MSNFKSRYIGDRAFYKKVLAIALPIIIQMSITNLVNLLDNVMVGSISTEAMSGVSIINQFIFIFTLLVFGASSAAGIFSAQYYGRGDVEGVRNTFRFKLIMNTLAAVMTVLVFLIFKTELVDSFLYDSDSTGDLAATRAFGIEYLLIMLVGLLPYALSQTYASTLRETRETLVPMLSSLVAVFTNLVLNYILIFGHLGAPEMGVGGAALATVISRFVELMILVIWTHTHKERAAFIKGAYRSLKVPRALLRAICIKGLPIMGNELLFSLALTVRSQFYSTRGLDVVAAVNISSTVTNLFNVFYFSVGSALAIIVGNLLGAEEYEKAKDTARKMIVFSIFAAFLMMGLLIPASSFIPLMYNVSSSVRELATYMLICTACIMPFNAFNNSCYYTVRAGGRIFATVILDSGMLWLFIIPVSFVITNFTSIGILLLYPICVALDSAKSVFGIIYLKKGNWARRFVAEEKRTQND